MKNKLLILTLALCLIFSPLISYATGAGYNPDAYSGEITFSDSLYENDEIAEEPRVTFEYIKNEQQTPENTPVIGCKAAYLADPVSGKIFYEKNAHEKMYPASTTKILTALLVLENCDPDDIVTVSQHAIDLKPVGYSSANLKAGEKLSVYTLLQALLIPSANEAAYALAEHVSGSVESFAALSNKRAKELGCESLHFVNPNGVHDDNHYCSAYDLYLIARECRKYDVFNEIVNTRQFTVPATDIYPRNDRTYANTNELILPLSGNYYPRCNGIKTGHTTPAGECLVSSSTEDNLNLICVVLGGRIIGGVNERFSDTKKLIDFVYDNYSRKLIADKSKPLTEINIENAVKDTPTLNVVLQTDIVTVAPNETDENNVITQISLPENLKAPIHENQVVGTVTYRADGMIYKTNLVAGNEIIKKPYWIYNSLISLAAILVIIMILSTVRKSKIRKAKRARRAG